jgi:hypothetical protein
MLGGKDINDTQFLVLKKKHVREENRSKNTQLCNAIFL